MLRVDEAVEVSVSQSGEPIGFRWRDECYLVMNHPVRWFARREWWVESARAYRGIGSGVLESEMWRLSANCNPDANRNLGANHNQEVMHFELLHNVAANAWQLVRVFA